MRKQILRLRKRGFTLPEVLVTVTVVAVLAAVVVPAVTQYVGRGNAPATQNDIQQIRNAVTGFITDMRTYPLNMHDLTATTAPGYASANGGTWHGPYLSGSVTTTLAGATGQGLGASGAAGATSYAFTSSGLSLSLADTILNTSTSTQGGVLQAVVLFPTTCSVVQHVDSLIDDGASGTGNFTWTNPGSCTSSTTATNVRLSVATVGK